MTTAKQQCMFVTICTPDDCERLGGGGKERNRHARIPYRRLERNESALPYIRKINIYIGYML